MKVLLACSLFIFTSLVYSFEQETKVASKESAEALSQSIYEANEEFGKNHTFLKAYKHWYKEESSAEFNKMIETISVELSDDFKLGSSIPQNKARCYSKCAQYGQGEIRKLVRSQTPSEDTRKCTRLCDSYYGEYNGFMWGLSKEKEKKLSAAADCSGVANSSGRKAKPTLGKVIDEIKLKATATQER